MDKQALEQIIKQTDAKYAIVHSRNRTETIMGIHGDNGVVLKRCTGEEVDYFNFRLPKSASSWVKAESIEHEEWLNKGKNKEKK